MIEQPRGMDFVRLGIALCRARGNIMQAAQIAEEEWARESPAARICRAAVQPGTTNDSTWAESLAVYRISAQQFLEAVKPRSLLGRLSGYRRAPLLTSVPVVTSSSTVSWIGQKAPVKLSSLALDSIVLPSTVISEELARLSTTAAERVIREDMIAATAAWIDRALLDPDAAAEVDVSPASLTNGAVNTFASTGGSVAQIDADLKQMVDAIVNEGIDLRSPFFIASPRMCVALSLKRGTGGGQCYPGTGATGGELLGIPLLATGSMPTSGSVGDSPADLTSSLVLVDCDQLVMSDPEMITIEASRNANIVMDTAPSSPPTASTVEVSMWQHNMVALRSQVTISWQMTNASAISVLTGCNW